MIKHKDQRVAVFVDAQNMYHSAKNLFSSNVNFQAVLQESVSGRILVRALAYGITSPGADESKFSDALSKQGFELRLKDLQIEKLTRRITKLENLEKEKINLIKNIETIENNAKYLKICDWFNSIDLEEIDEIMEKYSNDVNHNIYTLFTWVRDKWGF